MRDKSNIASKEKQLLQVLIKLTAFVGQDNIDSNYISNILRSASLVSSRVRGSDHANKIKYRLSKRHHK